MATRGRRSRDPDQATLAARSEMNGEKAEKLLAKSRAPRKPQKPKKAALGPENVALALSQLIEARTHDAPGLEAFECKAVQDTLANYAIAIQDKKGKVDRVLYVSVAEVEDKDLVSHICEELRT